MATRTTTAKKTAAAGGKKTTAKAATRPSSATKKAPVKKATPKKTTAKATNAKTTNAKTTNAKAPVKKTPAAKKTAPAKKAPAKTAGKAATAAKTKATPPKPVPTKPKKSPFPAKFLQQQEEALRAERATYTRQADTLRAEADALVADFEPGDVQFDEESGEGDTLNIERERDLALSAQARQAVEEIDHALAKFADGTYGLCEVSGEPIPKERLEAIPWARERVEYKIGGLGRR
jgi:RNA polymerase-binding transcription factor DksA